MKFTLVYEGQLTDRGINTVKSPSATIGDRVVPLAVGRPCYKANFMQRLVARGEPAFTKLDPIYAAISKANGSVKHKHTIRREFHKQLQQLWKLEPLSGHATQGFLSDSPPAGELSIIQRVGSFRFAPLVSGELHLKGELDITLLRPEAPGGIVGQGGDIDNRMKTLLDALRMPKSPGEIPCGEIQEPNEDPFFCLFEDDGLIRALSVGTDRLLRLGIGPSEVVLIIRVVTHATNLTYANIDLA